MQHDSRSAEIPNADRGQLGEPRAAGVAQPDVEAKASDASLAAALPAARATDALRRGGARPVHVRLDRALQPGTEVTGRRRATQCLVGVERNRPGRLGRERRVRVTRGVRSDRGFGVAAGHRDRKDERSQRRATRSLR